VHDFIDYLKKSFPTIPSAHIETAAQKAWDNIKEQDHGDGDTSSVPLPALGADSSNVIASGFSSGSFTAAQLMTVHPRSFGCAGLLNGGMTNTQIARKLAYASASTDEDKNSLYEETKDII
jgi:DNA-binding NarL/FixJ family response regulator